MRHTHKLLLFFLVSVLLVSNAFSYSGSVSGTLNSSNSTWSDSIDLTGPVTVPAGVTLTIEAGTSVRGNNTITTDGGIVDVNGTVEQPVDFFHSSFSLSGGGPHSIEFAILLSWGASAIEVNNAEASLRHIQIQQFSFNGIYIQGASSVVDIEFCTIGSKDRLFEGDEAVSILIASECTNDNISIRNSVLGFLDNNINTGLKIEAASTTIEVAYTFIAGPLSQINSSNTTNVYTGENPMIKDIPNLDHHLDWYSPCIDAGDPSSDYSSEPEPNGDRVNLGYYGGTSDTRVSAIDIRNPDGGDSLTPGNDYTIEWWSSKYSGNKQLQYSADSGQTWNDITEITDDQGTYSWTVPAEKSPNCLVKMYYSSASEVAGQSGAVFTIGDTVGANVGDTVDTNVTLKDPKYFKVLCYGPYRPGQAPGGAEPTYAQKLEDLELIEPYAHGIRLYGVDEDAVDICEDLGLNVHLGIWINKGLTDWDTEASDKSQMDAAIALVNSGYSSIKSVIVGNEYLLRNRHALKDMDAAEEYLISCIDYVRDNITTDLPLTTGESWPDWQAASDLYRAVDFVCWHVHPWWEQKHIDVAAEYAVITPDAAYQEMLDRIVEEGVPDKEVILGETGYPWGQDNGAAVGSEENQAQYLQDLHVLARQEGLEYWFFEVFDEEWKASMEGGVGDKWGMWGADHDPANTHYIVDHLSELIPEHLMWENPDSASTDVKPRETAINQIRLAPTAYDQIKVYNMQGRLIRSINRKGGLLKTEDMKGLNTARGIYLVNYLLKGEVVKTEKNLTVNPLR